MKKERASTRQALAIILLASALVAVPLLVLSASARLQQWIRYTPVPGQVQLTCWTRTGEVYVTVTITFPNKGFEVKNWGNINTKDYTIWADSEIWMSAGPSIPVVWQSCHTYSLGLLKCGTYTFNFEAWGQVIKSVNLLIVPPPTVTPPSPIIPMLPSSPTC